ncbi:TetR/AcrR family transcriptional regulator [Rhodococcus pyridinivorans]|uniref:TetR/AcrR family transcriptional regulator n=1 Tax=Rhodococcus pyridinivorans TaxID=103816 RepID=UPI0020C6A49A|nr:TetR/AcrR family transcriptional regulator [Rhodococcus pyridinivorans]UTM35284.1 TetR/AcrR family transcriptional regulator [Rhodococcus pyridinivorans]
MDISVKDITEAAGIKRPNFYFYFESKDEVLGELVGRAWDDWADRIGGYHRRADESHADNFDRLFGTSYRAWVERDRVMVAGLQAVNYDDKLDARWMSLVTDLDGQLAAQMSRDSDAGAITSLSDDHDGLVTTLTDMIVMAFSRTDRTRRRIESTDTAACYRLRGVMPPVHAPLYYREAVRFSATSSPSFRRALRTARLLG